MANPLSTDRRVVVTGMGLVSCLGSTLGEVTQSLKDGKSGIVLVDERVQRGFRSPLSCKLPDIDPSSFLSKKERRTMPEHVVYAAAAAENAFKESGTPCEIFDSEKAGIIIGNDSSAGSAAEVLETVDRDNTTQHLGSGAVVKSMNSSPSMNLGSKYKVKGASLTISAACASGAQSIGLSYLLIKLGWVDLMMTGGCQELCWQSMVAFDALMTFSTRIDSPAQASRPFDKDRDGLVPSGGAAILFLEEMNSAIKRNAKIYAEVIGYGITSDGYHLTEPNTMGAERCIRNVLDQAGISPKEVDYINAHATATIRGDLVEATVINAIFGANGPAVSSTKSMTGHECWMAGASEIIYSLLMMENGFVAPNINFTGFSDDMPEFNLATSTETKDLRVVMSNSFGFGGTNACLLLKKFEG